MLRKATRIGFMVLGVLILLSGTPGLADTSEVEAALERAIEESEAESDGDGSEEESAPAAAPAPQGPSGPLSRLSVHGFLTQAWADANYTEVPLGVLPPIPGVRPPGVVGPLGSSPDLVETTLGIPEGGTTNYRDLALQFRYDMSDKDIFVVQLSSTAVGDSPLQNFGEEIELDWAFYERRLTDNTSLKVGRVQIPLGIYNELRDVGTILPLYRPSSLFYGQDAFTSETVDGLAFTHTFFADSAWNFEASAYAGEWTSIIFAPGISNEIARAEDGFGYQFWLRSPWNVSLGTGMVSFDHKGGGVLEPINGRREIFHASLDAIFGRFTLQAEWKGETDVQVDLGARVPPGVLRGFDVSEWYALVGFQATEKLRIFAQSETAFFRGRWIPIGVSDVGRKQREDVALALNYGFTPTIVLKAEYHWTVSRGFNVFPDFSTGQFRLRDDIYEADDGSYSILALAVSF